jgi:hypothetical protein
MLRRYGQKAWVHFWRGGLSRDVSGNQAQLIFKELAKELHKEPAVLSRGLGKLAEELASKSELRSVVETL